MVKSKVTPFITLNGKSKEAMDFYARVLPETKITRMDFYKESPDFSEVEEELVLYGALSIKGAEVFFLDMQEQYPAPEPTWAHSIYLDCDTEQEFDQIFAALSETGSVMMGPESVGNIRKCAWITDKFGITWQPVWE
ncbi:VOC family protein [Lactococcus muris]|uniref:VOC family protein n=1 Tax=Lactococcus muris TaxID=2941330 RepID=A0ABV4DDG7_9LACT|nr:MULTISPECIES: VOC family protein [Lactococcus]MBL3715834.1 VOC family protein [Lactococcus garvieae]HAP16076.1 VOC family protein [Lactococcus sp.]